MQHLSLLFRLLPPLLALSFITNLAILISPLFMMQVLDRVIPSGNTTTLLMLGLLAAGALLLQAAVDTARDKSLGRIARWVEKTGTSRALGAPDPQARIEQIARVSQFLSGSLAITVLSLPWLPLLALVLFALHPLFCVTLFGLLALSSAIRWIANLMRRPHEASADLSAAREQDYLIKSARHHGKGAGTAANLRQRYAGFQTKKLAALDHAHSSKALGDALGAMIRQGTQIIALGLGAYLVTQDALSAGGMIAASLLLGKTFATAEGALTQMPAIRAALSDFQALRSERVEPEKPATDIASLNGSLKAESLIFPSEAGAPPRLDRVSFSLNAGECLVIAGSSGSGKTTLLKALAGVAQAPIGAVYLDESEIRGLADQNLFRHVGYLPQLAPILPGTIAENISCFANDPCDAQIVEAAKTAGMHGLISALPHSYDSDLEQQPYLLSAGQKQRLALARAIFNTPAYLFLDEPNALLDAEGERALFQTLAKLKERGTTIVMVLHRSGVMALADKVMRLEGGRIADFGPRGEVLGRMAAGRRQTELPLLESSIQDLCDWVSAQFNRADDADFSQHAQLVATELFTSMRLNGPSDKSRKIHMAFEFLEDTSGRMTFIEHAVNEAPDIVTDLKTRRKTSPFALQNLAAHETAIAALLDLSDSVEAKTEADSTCITVTINSQANRPKPPFMKLA
ncbi:ATP-binding cassette domain-containing protein [Cognatishimia sp.]|uniref:ATP-binding cassette domain-containing protein n=1 Tax=Cognatishimia sp. TaxID=2211648 RepID=UPI0035117433|nr:ATP-binding cassette domain-containing protein [Cognatishimia sp.]